MTGVDSAAARPLIAVLDYGIGNLRSAQKALERMGADARLTADHRLVADAAGVVLPGVGAFGACIQALQQAGLAEDAIEAAGSPRPFLGVCVGMQMLFDGSDESPDVDGLGVFAGRIRRLPDGVKHPQMQWNTLVVEHQHSLLDGLRDPSWMYFVHSYAPERSAGGDEVVASCEYGGPIVAAVARDNVFATQFHPEKSGDDGLKLLANFAASCT